MQPTLECLRTVMAQQLLVGLMLALGLSGTLPIPYTPSLGPQVLSP